jgi:peptidoglycan hydrolase-like protein with peptidoglycan-binding domain
MTGAQNESQAIRNLQRYLRTLSYFEKELPEVPIDGIYDTATENAVRIFQRLEDLPQTGRVDRPTWDRLYARYREDQSRRDTPARISHFPRLPENYSVELGETQFLVRVIQHALQELAVLYTWEEAVPLSGIYDEATARAVRQFQGANGLPATGGVDLTTWNALADAYNRTFANYFEQ